MRGLLVIHVGKDGAVLMEREQGKLNEKKTLLRMMQLKVRLREVRTNIDQVPILGNKCSKKEEKNVTLQDIRGRKIRENWHSFHTCRF